MKKTILAIPLLLLLVSCQSREEKIRDTCARWAAGEKDFQSIVVVKQLGLDDDDKGARFALSRYCEWYK